MNFVTLHLQTENIHLIKDVGMIPYLLHRDYGFNSRIATWECGSYPGLDDEVPGLSIDFVKKSILGRVYDGMHYLKYEASSIDVLNIYHLNLASFFYERVYRKYNPMGKIYLKLDMNNKGFTDLFRYDPRGFIKRATIKNADIVSVENKTMYEALAKRFGDKIAYIPNGYYMEEEASEGQENGIKEANEAPMEKEQLILTVGNLGTPEKATDVLLEAFALSADRHDLSLCLIGPVEPSFEAEKESFFKKHPSLKERVTFTGAISDRKELTKYYKRARFFALPSKSESFGFVLLEAALNGCFLIASDGCSAAFDVTNKEKYGMIVKDCNAEALAEAFCKLNLSSPDNAQLRAEEMRYIREKYSWKVIISKLHILINDLFVQG